MIKGDWMHDLRQRLRPHAASIAIGLLGFALGGLVFGVRACTSEPPVAPPAVTDASDEEGVWTCAMHPQIRSDEPGQCPICGMDLIPVSAEPSAAADPSQVVLSERAQALARLRTTELRRQADTAAHVRLLGRVLPDETTLKTVTAWTGGRIDDLLVNVTGERVRAGQAIAVLYSPEVFAAHQDLLVAQRQVAAMARGPASSRQAVQAALDAARQRLRLLGVPEREVRRMLRADEPARSVPIRTPFGGTVIERMATEGAYVETGSPLYRIADLRTLWVQLDAYESDLPRLSVGQPVRVEVDALPGEVFEGKVTFIDPTLDPRRRVAQVRVEVNNPKGRLRPGMFAEAIVLAGNGVDQAQPLVIPASAPLFTGRRAVVYVEVEQGGRVAYEPRTVRLGPRLGEVYPVVAGLSEGDVVVTRGAFALDADLQIRGGPSMMTAPDDRQPGPFDAAIELSAAQRRKLAPVVESYLDVQRALAEDDLTAAKLAAAKLAEALPNVELERPAEAAAAWKELSQPLDGHARHISRAEDLESARAGFEALSEAVATLLRRFGNPLDRPLHLAFCPMAAGTEGAFWIQQGEEIDNAYFGESMRTCGEVRMEVEGGAYLRAPESEAAPPAPAAPMGGHQH